MPYGRIPTKTSTPPVKSNNNSITQSGNPNVKTDSAVFATTPANEPESQNQPLNLFHTEPQTSQPPKTQIIIGANRTTSTEQTSASSERRNTISDEENLNINQQRKPNVNKWQSRRPGSAVITNSNPTSISPSGQLPTTSVGSINNNNTLINTSIDRTLRLSQVIPTKVSLPEFCTLKNGTLKIKNGPLTINSNRILTKNEEREAAQHFAVILTYLKSTTEIIKVDFSNAKWLATQDENFKTTRFERIAIVFSTNQKITEFNLAGSDFKVFLNIFKRAQKRVNNVSFNNPLQFSYINKLNISNCKLDAEDVKELFNSPSNLLNIVVFDISKNNIGPDGAKLIPTKMPQLKELYINDNKLGNPGAAELSGCSLKGEPAEGTVIMKSLEVLDIGSNNLDSLGTKLICDNIPNLRELGLSHNQIDITGLNHVSEYIEKRNKEEQAKPRQTPFGFVLDITSNNLDFQDTKVKPIIESILNNNVQMANESPE